MAKSFGAVTASHRLPISPMILQEQNSKNDRQMNRIGRRSTRSLQRPEDCERAHNGRSEHQDGQVGRYALLRSLGHG
jgi:hypothetical protein